MDLYRTRALFGFDLPLLMRSYERSPSYCGDNNAGATKRQGGWSLSHDKEDPHRIEDRFNYWNEHRLKGGNVGYRLCVEVVRESELKDSKEHHSDDRMNGPGA